ncbi:MAG: Acetyl-CoA carboxylase biotin carboxyl carrier protein subunit, partial [Pseudomonadota bacterium]|nr:Acetyl-CoA carboxylase biotin carboxyl carrier protein subunit [Pseudomonadota bacterium]
MEKKFRITVEGKQYIVAVEDLSEGTQSLYPDPGSMSVVPQPAAPVPTAPAPTSTSTASPSAAAGPGDELAPLGGVVQTI